MVLKPLREALSATTDKAIKASLATEACRQRWYQARVMVFRRLRFLSRSGKPHAWLHELTYMALPPEVEKEVEERIRYLIEKRIRMVSLGSLLSFAASMGITVAVLGGLDSIGGTIVAGLLLGMFQGVASGYLDRLVGGGSRELVVAATLVLTILIRPHGLFGREDIQRI